MKLYIYIMHIDQRRGCADHQLHQASRGIAIEMTKWIACVHNVQVSYLDPSRSWVTWTHGVVVTGCLLAVSTAIPSSRSQCMAIVRNYEYLGK
jgi:hypothetical protein